MQNLKKISTLFVTTLLLAALGVIGRFVLISNYFDAETKFFTNTTFAIIVSVYVILSAVAMYILSKKISYAIPSSGTLPSVLNICASIVFVIILFITLTTKSQLPVNGIEKVTNVISCIAAIMSVIYYSASAVFAFSKKNLYTGVFRLMNLSPVLYLASELISTFAKVSGQANSLYYFPYIISILVLAFFIFTDSKSKIIGLSNNRVPVLGYSLVSLIVLPFSAIPDLALHFKGTVPLSKIEITHCILNLLYFVYITSMLIAKLNAFKEDKQ